MSAVTCTGTVAYLASHGGLVARAETAGELLTSRLARQISHTSYVVDYSSLREDMIEATHTTSKRLVALPVPRYVVDYV